MPRACSTHTTGEPACSPLQSGGGQTLTFDLT
jgi:hypothetical protein